MQQNTDVKNWLDCSREWNGPDNDIAKLGSPGFWNKAWENRSDHTAKRLRPGRKERLISDLFGMLEEAGFQADGAHILDIGCGPGALSIPLARAGAKVTALDISSTALDFIRETADREGLSIEPVECSWWTADIDKLGFRNQFDLVVASMTPSIKDVKTFDRMRACSRKFCYYSGGVPGGREKLHKEIFRTILNQDPPQNQRGGSWFLYHFMYLYLCGFRPVVRIHKMNHRREAGWEEAADMAIRSLDRTGEFSDESKEKIRKYYRNAAVNGKCISRAGGYMGMMVWDERRSNQ
ncbi:class I SAM-dependent methyltransferase [Methanoregula sp.]|uniref:class I SAM-dependent methyltransferase n=1 Tax=Methanoregula sp. TaxID=2052170 RepID=UPI0026185A18|nr:class I SAM-dependent methyltransferase [Methanoregula sp.]MDD5142791.1 methyltransferase domain-containing protein [Methanoregula sp.]